MYAKVTKSRYAIGQKSETFENSNLTCRHVRTSLYFTYQSQASSPAIGQYILAYTHYIYIHPDAQP